MSRVNGHTLEEVIEAIQESHGLLALAARRLGVSRNTVYRYVKEYATVRQAIDEAREANLDFAESKLMQAVNNGSIPAIMFLLKTVGRNRGYVERQEVTTPDDKPLTIRVIYDSSETDTDGGNNAEAA